MTMNAKLGRVVIYNVEPTHINLHDSLITYPEEIT